AKARPAGRASQLTQRGDDFVGRLHELDECALAADRELVVALRMNEANFVARGAATDAARREADALFRQPVHGVLQVVDPKSDVVELWNVNFGALFGIDRLHEIDFDGERTMTDTGDVFVDIFSFAPVVALAREAHDVDPKMGELGFVERAHGDLLNSENAKR